MVFLFKGLGVPSAIFDVGYPFKLLSGGEKKTQIQARALIRRSKGKGEENSTFFV